MLPVSAYYKPRTMTTPGSTANTGPISQAPVPTGTVSGTPGGLGGNTGGAPAAVDTSKLTGQVNTVSSTPSPNQGANVSAGTAGGTLSASQQAALDAAKGVSNSLATAVSAAVTGGQQNAVNAAKGTVDSLANAVKTAVDSSPMAELDKYYNDLLAADEKTWQQSQGMLQNQMSGFARQGDILSNRLGHSVGGGGYAMMSGQALAKGMQVYNQADIAHQQQERQLRLDYMDKRIEEARRQEDRTHQVEDQNAAWDRESQQAVLEMIASGNIPPGMTEEELRELVGLEPKAVEEGGGGTGAGTGPVDANGVKTVMPTVAPDGSFKSADGTPVNVTQANAAVDRFDTGMGVTNMDVDGMYTGIRNWILTQQYDPGMWMWGGNWEGNSNKYIEFFKNNPEAFADFNRYVSAYTRGVPPKFEELHSKLLKG